MKKISLKIAAIVLLSSVVFFACKKEEAPVVDPCQSAATALSTQNTAYTSALLAFQADLENSVKCNAVKTSLMDLIKTAESCPTYASQVAGYKPLLALYACEQNYK